MTSSFRWRVSGTTLTLVMGAAIAAASITPASAATPPKSATPAVEVCGEGPALVRPGSMILTCADEGEQAVHLHWSSWTVTKATATGTVIWRACTADCADSKQWDSATAEITLTQPKQEPGNKLLFTRLGLRVTGRTPPGFLRNLAFDESPRTSASLPPRALSPLAHTPGPSMALPQAATPSGSLGYAQIEGFWIDAGGPGSADGSYTYAQVAAAIAGAESSFLPGTIQQGVDYCGSGADRAGWGLWQITCGNSVPAYGTNFQLLDPWNNAEAAVSRYDAMVAAGYDGFEPWSTYTSGAYAGYLQDTAPDTARTDPGEYVQVGSTPPGTPSSPAASPGSTYGPPMPSAGSSALPAAPPLAGGPAVSDPIFGSTEVYAVGSDGSLQQDAYKPGSGWSWLGLGGNITGTPSAVYDPATNDMEVYATGVNGALYQIAYRPGSGWSSWVNLGGDITGSPKAIFDENNGDMEVYATGANGALYEIAYRPGSGWTSWINLGGDITGNPSVVADPAADGHIEVYATSVTSHLYQISYVPGSGWTTWLNLGSTITGSPSAVYDPNDGTMQVYATAASGAVYQIVYQPGSGWSGWLNLGGDIAGSPSAVYDSGMGSMEVYATGIQGPLYQAVYNHSSGWSSWDNLGGDIRNDPDPLSDPITGNLEVYAASATNHLYQLAYVPGSGWGSWLNLGGTISET